MSHGIGDLAIVIGIDTYVGEERLDFLRRSVANFPRLMRLILWFPLTFWLLKRWVVAGVKVSV